MDLKTLFHNPEELSDDELLLLREKLSMSNSIPRVSAVFGGLTMYLLDRHILRKGHSWLRIGGAAAAAFVLGAYGTHEV